MTEARFYHAEENTVCCDLCPRRCRIAPGKRGACAVRMNCGGRLESLVYGAPSAVQNDPIEKKPFAEFMPGSRAFSIGTLGCNFFCKNCQNDTLSRGLPEGAPAKPVPPQAIVETALRHHCESIAFTYNEPTIWAEYAIDIADLAHPAGLKTVLVTNGYITREAAAELYPRIDAANIDLKSMDPEFYRENCGGELEDVLNAIRQYHATGGHLELTTLVIPGRNDAPEEIEKVFDFAASLQDKKVVLHFSRFFPYYRMRDVPATPPETLYRIREQGERRGFRVRLGNL